MVEMIIEYNWKCPMCLAHGNPPRKNSKPKTKLKAHKNGIRHIRRVHKIDSEPIIEAHEIKEGN